MAFLENDNQKMMNMPRDDRKRYASLSYDHQCNQSYVSSILSVWHHQLSKALMAVLPMPFPCLSPGTIEDAANAEID